MNANGENSLMAAKRGQAIMSGRDAQMETMTRIVIVSLLLAGVIGEAPYGQQPSQEPAAFVAFYWRARPGRLEAYNEYIRGVAVPIDADAQRHGVFEELRTVMPALGTTTDWTHLRIFRVKNAAAVETFQSGMDAASARVVPDEAQRKANSERATGLRDLVRREVWTELR